MLALSVFKTFNTVTSIQFIRQYLSIIGNKKHFNLIKRKMTCNSGNAELDQRIQEWLKWDKVRTAKIRHEFKALFEWSWDQFARSEEVPNLFYVNYGEVATYLFFNNIIM